MGRSKAKRPVPAAKRSEAPAVDLAAVSLPSWVTSAAAGSGSLAELAQRLRVLHDALGKATLAAHQIDALRDFKGSMHAWIPRKRRQPAVDDTAKAGDDATGSDAAAAVAAALVAADAYEAVQAERRGFDFLLALFAHPAAGHALLRPTLKGLLEAVAPAEARAAACEAMAASAAPAAAGGEPGHGPVRWRWRAVESAWAVSVDGGGGGSRGEYVAGAALALAARVRAAAAAELGLSAVTAVDDGQSGVSYDP
eukprot:g7089.t1